MLVPVKVKNRVCRVGNLEFELETPFLGLKGVVGNFTDFESAGI